MLNLFTKSPFKVLAPIFSASPLIGASVAYAAINLVVLPLVTRLFDPQSYGVYVVFLSVVNIIASVANLRFQLALMLPSGEADAIALNRVSRYVSVLVAVLTTLAVGGFGQLIFRGEFVEISQGVGLLILGSTVICLGVFQADQAYLQRIGRFGWMATGRLLQGCLFVLVSIFLGMQGVERGLVIGVLASYLSAAILTAALIRPCLSKVEKKSFRHAASLAFEYREFPTISSLGALLNSLASNFPVVVVAYVLTESDAGVFGLAILLLNAPISAVARPIGQVLYQKYSRSNTREDRVAVFKGFVLVLTAISVLGYLVIGVSARFVEDLLGSGWLGVGGIVPLLAVASALRFVVSPASVVLTSHRWLTSILVWQLLYFVFFLLVFLQYEPRGLIEFVRIFVLIDIVAYCLYSALILRAVYTHAVNNSM